MGNIVQFVVMGAVLPENANGQVALPVLLLQKTLIVWAEGRNL